MDALSLEALDAGSGDAFLLHYGDPRAPALTMVDAGLARTYRERLLPRLAEVGAGHGGVAQLELAAISHIDDDHIAGMAALAADLAQRADDRIAPHVVVGGLWHNSLDDSVPDASAAAPFVAANTATMAKAAGFRTGIALRDYARRLGWRVNEPFGGVVVAGGPAVTTPAGLSLTVVAPSSRRLDDLRADWAEYVAAQRAKSDAARVATAAAAVDDSVTNLSSIVLLAEHHGRRILLTGDAIAQDILDGLRAAGVLGRQGMHVDILKMPHHGSRRNVSAEMLSSVTADRYVFSADGRHGNPDVATFQLLGQVRDPRSFVVVLTHLTKSVGDFFAGEAAARRPWRVAVRAAHAPSVVVHLGAVPASLPPRIGGVHLH